MRGLYSGTYNSRFTIKVILLSAELRHCVFWQTSTNVLQLGLKGRHEPHWRRGQGSDHRRCQSAEQWAPLAGDSSLTHTLREWNNATSKNKSSVGLTVCVAPVRPVTALFRASPLLLTGYSSWPPRPHHLSYTVGPYQTWLTIALKTEMVYSSETFITTARLHSVMIKKPIIWIFPAVKT
jgi:hypothetical protein